MNFTSNSFYFSFRRLLYFKIFHKLRKLSLVNLYFCQTQIILKGRSSRPGSVLQMSLWFICQGLQVSSIVGPSLLTFWAPATGLSVVLRSWPSALGCALCTLLEMGCASVLLRSACALQPSVAWSSRSRQPGLTFSLSLICLEVWQTSLLAVDWCIADKSMC